MSNVEIIVERIQRIDGLIRDKKIELDLKTVFIKKRGELMNKLKKDIEKLAFVSYMAGVLNGLSMRKDLPQEVIELCKRTYKKYLELYNEK
jgi:hypothetical protein